MTILNTSKYVSLLQLCQLACQAPLVALTWECDSPVHHFNDPYCCSLALYDRRLYLVEESQRRRFVLGKPGPEDCGIEWKAELAMKPLFLNILRVIHDERVADAPPPPSVQVILDPPRVDSIIGVVGWLLGQAFKRGIPGVYEAFRENGSLGYIANKSSLHLEFIEGLRGYITGLSGAKTRKLPDIQEDLLDWHIEDLHQAPVIRCICASIAPSITPPCPILSSLTSIAPHNDKWPNILQTLKLLDDEYSVQCYTLHPTDNGTPNDMKRWKKDMKEIVRILAECLEEAKGSNNDINQPSTSSNNLTGGLETDHESGWRPYPNTDIELGLRGLGNVGAT
ncbi:hypothetical protein EV421DRAFT_1924779 [Armillaria borealis]|uniref:Uncharacterized protein n=1 Tax=Armillaria borealis TaxID=47425 RepID=A0AA39MFQ1_9AGAR|nr:hypothetical protein EV421DRAFT_1924779 [Armillaria borealis]